MVGGERTGRERESKESKQDFEGNVRGKEDLKMILKCARRCPRCLFWTCSGPGFVLSPEPEAETGFGEYNNYKRLRWHFLAPTSQKQV